MTAGADACRLYDAVVTHARTRPARHALRYRLFMMLLDLDQLPALAARLRLFSVGRFNLLSFHDTDHGSRQAGALRSWVEACLAEAGIATSGGRIRLLCMPRLLGSAFNPLSVYFCDAPDGTPAGVVYEVRNTFGERHVYAAAVGDGAVLRHACGKTFHVSPFMPMGMRYDFATRLPGGRLALGIRGSDEAGTLIETALHGRAVPFTDRVVLRLMARLPLMGGTLVLGAIHWEALRIALKGVRLHRKPAPPRHHVTVMPVP